MMRRALPLLLLLLTALAQAEPVRIGSKTFAENYILAEAAALLLEARGYEVERRFGMNGTQILFDALSNDEIDLYPEYTGTISEVILKDPALNDLESLRGALAPQGFELFDPIGFENAYAVAASTAAAAHHGLRRISDLREAPSLRIALPHEFLNRQDGWPGLKAHYGIERDAAGIEHSLAYEAIKAGSVDLIAVYTSDGQIELSDLVILEDELDFFPNTKPRSWRGTM